MAGDEADKVILATDAAALHENPRFNGWVDREGFFHKTEEQARSAGATHSLCEDCGDPCRKFWKACDPCLRERARARWLQLPVEDWDGRSPLVLYEDDRYFWIIDELEQYVDDYEVEPSTLMLQHCAPMKPPQVDIQYIEEQFQVEDEVVLPEQVRVALDALNAAIREHAPKYWEARSARPDDSILAELEAKGDRDG